MGELHEIVSVEATEKLFVMLAIVLPVLGTLVGALVGVYHKKNRRYGVLGTLLGMIGPLNWLMWHIFTVLTERNGLDTVQNVFVNLAIFVFVGVSVGVGIGLYLRRTDVSSQAEVIEATEAPQA